MICQHTGCRLRCCWLLSDNPPPAAATFAPVFIWGHFSPLFFKTGDLETHLQFIFFYDPTTFEHRKLRMTVVVWHVKANSRGAVIKKKSRIRLPTISCVMVICGSKWLKIGFAPGLPVRPRDTPHRWVRTNFGPAQTTESPWHKPMVVNGVVGGSVRRGRGGDRYSQRRS